MGLAYRLRKPRFGFFLALEPLNHDVQQLHHGVPLALSGSASAASLWPPLCRNRLTLHLHHRSAATVRSLGFCPPRRPEEEDLAHEKASSPNGWKGFEGCSKSQQVSGLWPGEASSSVVSQLRKRYVCACGGMFVAMPLSSSDAYWILRLRGKKARRRKQAGIVKLTPRIDIQQSWKSAQTA